MHVGMGTCFQNPGHARPDRKIWRQGLEMADAAEPLGGRVSFAGEVSEVDADAIAAEYVSSGH